MPKLPTVFISYRRELSVDLAQSIHTRLKIAGVDVFIDLDAIDGGEDFELRLERELDQRDCLLVILAPETLNRSAWVPREIASALRHGKKIIPVTTGGYAFSRQSLPPEIADLARYSYVPYEPLYANAAFDKIKRSLGITDNIDSSPTPSAGTTLLPSAPPPQPTSARSLFLVPVVAILSVALFAAGISVGLHQIFNIRIDLTRTALAVANGTNSISVTQTPSRTPLPTITPTQISIEVASIPVRIFSISGIEIGNGTVRVFAPENIESSQSTTIELELNLDYRYITPTPAGPITPIAITPITSTPRPGRATPTPRVPIYIENNITAYQRMGATLRCPTGRFTGCDTTQDPATAKLVNWENGAKWSWIIAPLEDANGLQNLQLELWTIKQVNDGPEQADVIWDHAFQIEVVRSTQPLNLVKLFQDNIGVVITGIFGIIVAFIGVGIGIPWWRKKSSKSKVFISYRRDGGTGAAQKIKDRLTADGADVFLDVDAIKEGLFEKKIKSAIESCDHFILVLAPGTLESDWVVKETTYAIEKQKKIIPVLVEGFNLDATTLPKGLESIEAHNVINLTAQYYEAGLERLTKFIGLEAEKGR